MATKNYYITKYGLTQGIVKVPAARVEVCRDVRPDGSMIAVDDSDYRAHYFKPDWYTRESEARGRVKVMVKKKLEALARQMDRLRNHKPEIVDG